MMKMMKSHLATSLCLLLILSSSLIASTDDSITVAAVGDIMLGSTFPVDRLPPEDGAKVLLPFASILSSADIAFGNLEGPMLDGGTSSKCGKRSSNCYAFRVPTRYGRYLKEAGFDVMSLANNHANDFGSEGMLSSKRVLAELGIAHTAEAGDIAQLQVKGRKIEVIGFATNAISYNLNDLETARRVVTEASNRADIVIVSFHGGAEGAANQNVPQGVEIYLGERRGDLRRFTHTVVDAGADLVLGHGPHVIRGMEVYKQRLIAYSLGNFATYGGFNLNGVLGLSMVLEARIALDGRILGGRVHPARQEKPGGPLQDSERAIIPIVNHLSTTDFGSSAVQVSGDGTLVLPTN